MNAVLFIGLQAAGKSTFFNRRFALTHVRISLDVLKTRVREAAAIQTALQQRRELVIDNTNPTAQDRQKYIQLAKSAGYRVIGYFFEPDIQGSLRRNAVRPVKERVPIPGLFRTRKLLQAPSLAEGFDELFTVRLNSDGDFEIFPGIQLPPAAAPPPPDTSSSPSGAACA